MTWDGLLYHQDFVWNLELERGIRDPENEMIIMDIEIKSTARVAKRGDRIILHLKTNLCTTVDGDVAVRQTAVLLTSMK